MKDHKLAETQASEPPTAQRPRHLTVISICLVLWGLVPTLASARESFAILRTLHGPLSPVLTIVQLHLLWIAVATGGIGVWKGKRWSRPLVACALFGLWVISSFAFNKSAGLGDSFAKGIIPALIVAFLFSRRANVYFAARTPTSPN